MDLIRGSVILLNSEERIAPATWTFSDKLELLWNQPGEITIPFSFSFILFLHLLATSNKLINCLGPIPLVDLDHIRWRIWVERSDFIDHALAAITDFLGFEFETRWINREHVTLILISLTRQLLEDRIRYGITQNRKQRSGPLELWNAGSDQLLPRSRSIGLFAVLKKRIFRRDRNKLGFLFYRIDDFFWGFKHREKYFTPIVPQPYFRKAFFK